MAEQIKLHSFRKEVDSTYVGFTPNGGSIKPVHVANGVQRCIFGGFNTAMQIKRLALVSDAKGNVPTGSELETIYAELAKNEEIEDGIAEGSVESMRNVMQRLLSADKGVYVVKGLMLVGGSTGSGKSVFLFSMLAALLMTHPEKEDMQLILSSSKLEDFIHFEGLPHLYSGRIISDATEATKVIKEVIFEESERRGRLLAEARVANIVEYNKKVAEKLAPIVVVIDEFADLADQLETTKEKNAFYKPVQRIAQAGRSRGIHLVICTQRPEAKLVPSTTKAQLNGRVALRVNDGISSRMIIEEPDAQYLQKHGDMIYRNGDIIERAQGYLIEIEELDKIVDDVIHGRI